MTDLAQLVDDVAQRLTRAEGVKATQADVRAKIVRFDTATPPDTIDGAPLEEWAVLAEEIESERAVVDMDATVALGLVRDRVPPGEWAELHARWLALSPSDSIRAHLADPATTDELESLYQHAPSTWTDYYRPAQQAPASRAPIDWATFWTTDFGADDWLCEPLLARGRSHALYAGAKTGKSLLLLEIAASLATGRRVLRQPAGRPLSVVYFDEEMTEADVRERLTDLGYGPDDDLSTFHYFVLPSLPPLDTEAGGREVMRITDDVDADLVVIDTMCRVIVGDENSADTMKAYARCTGQPLKAAGRTVIRLDHAGKAEEAGQRGTSAKNDDVDVVWSLKPTEGGLRLKATHRRLSWVPDEINLTRTEDPLRHVASGLGYASGTKELAETLDRLNVPITMGRSKVREVLKEHDIKARNTLLNDAIRWRREAAEEAENLSRTGPTTQSLKSVPDSSGTAA